MANPKLSFNSVLRVFRNNRERIVIIILLVLGFYLGRQVFELGRRMSEETEIDKIIDEVLTQMGYGITGSTTGETKTPKVDPKKVIANLVRVPGEERVVRPIVKKLPFSPRENIENIRKKVRDLISEAESQMESGNWGKAIELWGEVQKLDPQSVMDLYPNGIPPERVEECRVSQTRQLMERYRAEADDQGVSGRQYLENGERSEAKETLISAQKKYQYVLDLDPARKIQAKEYYDEIDKNLADLKQVIEQLVRETLNEEILKNLADAKREFDAYQADSRALDRLAFARRILEEAKKKIATEDPDGQYAQPESVGNVEELYKSVIAAVQNVTPALDSQAAELRKTEGVEDNSEILRRYGEAITVLELLTSLHPDEETYRTALGEVSTKQQVLRKSENLSQAKSLYDQALQLYTEAQEAQQKRDKDTATKKQGEGIEKLDRILNEFPPEDVESLKSGAEELLKRLTLLIEVAPSVKGALLEGFEEGNQVAIITYGTYKEKPHKVGVRSPFTQLTVTEIDPSPNPQWVIISRKNYADTKITLTP